MSIIIIIIIIAEPGRLVQLRGHLRGLEAGHAHVELLRPFYSLPMMYM